MGGLFSSNDPPPRPIIRHTSDAFDIYLQNEIRKRERLEKEQEEIRRQNNLRYLEAEKQRRERIRREAEEAQRIASRKPRPQKIQRDEFFYNYVSNTPYALTWEDKQPNGNTFSIVTLNNNTNEYKEIFRLFKSSTKKTFKVRKIERIQNHFLLAAFLLKKEELRQKNGSEPNVQMLFHGTGKKNIDSICKDNLDWRKRGSNVGHRFGQGISFTPISFYASHYCDKYTYDKVMLVVNVLIGHTTEGKQNTLIPPDGYDTTMKPDGKVFVKFDDDEYYPAYKITYYIEEALDNLNM